MSLLLDCIIYDWMIGTLKDNACIEKTQTEGGLVSSVAVFKKGSWHFFIEKNSQLKQINTIKAFL